MAGKASGGSPLGMKRRPRSYLQRGGGAGWHVPKNKQNQTASRIDGSAHRTSGRTAPHNAGGQRPGVVENHSGLLAYTTKRIQFHTGEGLLTITGTHLTLDCMASGAVRIGGRVQGVALGGSRPMRNLWQLFQGYGE